MPASISASTRCWSKDYFKKYAISTLSTIFRQKGRMFIDWNRAQKSNMESSTSEEKNVFTKGVLQSIGFKEFMPYLRKFDEAEDERIRMYLQGKSCQAQPTGLETLHECLERLKLVTRRYSKRQIKWIRNRFLSSTDRQVPDVYELDASDVGRWKEDVTARAFSIIDCYRQDRPSVFKPMPRLIHLAAGLNNEVMTILRTWRKVITPF